MRLTHALVVLALVLFAQAAAAQTPCSGGTAGPYACNGVDLMAHLPLGSFVSPGSGAPSAANDIWGWTDAETGREYALVGLTNGTAFVDVTAPAAPVFLGKLPTATSNSSWRDVKTVGDYAVVVSEAGSHGMQVFDLTRLRGVAGPPVTFTADARYTGFGSAHNVVVDEASAMAYGVGASAAGCGGGGLHMVDLSDPLSPTFAGCYDGDGYTHDAQCLVYDGPDEDYVGRQICVASNEDTVTIVDVTEKGSPVEIAKARYPNPSYTHQGWFTEDQRYFVVNDELDGNNATPTRTIVMDLADLDEPEFAYFQDGTTSATDHNLYVLGDRVFQSNYAAGLRILDASGITGGALPEVAYFDTYPAHDAHGFNGQWSNYPYFPSGTVIANDINTGFFVLDPGSAAPPSASVAPGSIAESLASGETASASVTVANGPGGGDLLYAATLQNLSQPDGPLAARPVAPVADLVPEPTRKGAPGTPGASPLAGGGGPDAFGYAWSDSDEPGGPSADFQDISGTGTAVTYTPTHTYPADDEGYADVALPFTFPFYGADHTDVRVYSNGFVTFSAFDGHSYDNLAIPSAADPDLVVAPFWDDLYVGGTTYTGTLPDGRFVVQWDGVPRFSDPGSSLTFQVLFSEDGRIEVQYGTMTASTLADATVGIENGDGSGGLQVVHNAPYVTADHAVRFFSPVVWAGLSGATNGSVAPGASATFSVELDATGLPAGSYSAELVVTTNDPTAPSVTVPVTLTVEGDGTTSIVIDGPRGVRYLGPPAEGVTVDDLAAQNLVRGVPGYYPTYSAPNLWTMYDPVAGTWVPSAGAGEELQLGYAFAWYVLDRDGVGDPEVSVSRTLPFTLSTDLPANDEAVIVALRTDGNRFNFLANPFGEVLAIDGIRDWPGGAGLAPNTPVWTYDASTGSWEDAPTSVGPWEAFRFRARGPRRNGNPRLLQIPPPSDAPTAPREAAAPTSRIAFALEGRTSNGRRLADGALTVAFADTARAAFDVEEDVEKFQPPAEAYALLGARGTGGTFVSYDARPFAAAEVPLALDARGAGSEFVLRWTAEALPTGLPVTLVDLSTGATVDIRSRSEYAFEAPSRPALDGLPTNDLAEGSAATDRFVLRIGDGLAAAEGATAELSLSAPAPNPSSSSARVAFAVPEGGPVRVSVYDVRGREVAVLIEGEVAAGRHEAVLESQSLAAGVYVVRLEAGGQVLTRQAVVVGR